MSGLLKVYREVIESVLLSVNPGVNQSCSPGFQFVLPFDLVDNDVKLITVTAMILCLITD